MTRLGAAREGAAAAAWLGLRGRGTARPGSSGGARLGLARQGQARQGRLGVSKSGSGSGFPGRCFVVAGPPADKDGGYTPGVASPAGGDCLRGEVAAGDQGGCDCGDHGPEHLGRGEADGDQDGGEDDEGTAAEVDLFGFGGDPVEGQGAVEDVEAGVCQGTCPFSYGDTVDITGRRAENYAVSVMRYVRSTGICGSGMFMFFFRAAGPKVP